jgi:hypothetical protein
MRPYSSIQVVRNLVQNLHRPHPQVFREPGWADLWELASRRGTRPHELANGLNLSTAVLSQDLSGTCVTFRE